MRTLKPGNKNPVVVGGERTLYVDIDETLVLTKWPPHLNEKTIVLQRFGHPFRVLPHKAHVDAIRQFKGRGHSVIIWSAGGAQWARSVVEALGISDCVDVIVGKPNWIIDDKPANTWMGERFFLDLEGTSIVDDRDAKESK